MEELLLIYRRFNIRKSLLQENKLNQINAERIDERWQWGKNCDNIFLTNGSRVTLIIFPFTEKETGWKNGFDYKMSPFNY